MKIKVFRQWTVVSMGVCKGTYGDVRARVFNALRVEVLLLMSSWLACCARPLIRSTRSNMAPRRNHPDPSPKGRGASGAVRRKGLAASFKSLLGGIPIGPLLFAIGIGWALAYPRLV